MLALDRIKTVAKENSENSEGGGLRREQVITAEWNLLMMYCNARSIFMVAA